MTERDALDYEIASSWWARELSNRWLQELAATYFCWKARRKFWHYRKTMEWRAARALSTPPAQHPDQPPRE